MKLMLGTAQFGLDYGISNLSGKTQRQEVEKILRKGAAGPTPFLDTAYSYGDSEKVLGNFNEILKKYSVVTKLPYIDKNNSDIQASFETSLKRLGLDKVYGLLFHDPQDLLGSRGLEHYQALLNLKEIGKVQKIGVSVYAVGQLKEILENFEVDLVQIPVNIFDRRFLRGGFLRELKDKGIEIHARSVFLQGLLLMETTGLNPFFEKIKPLLASFREQVLKKGYSPQEVCLAFVKAIDEVDRIVIGVNDLSQLEELISIYDRKIDFNYSHFESSDENILLPSNWKLA
jgi:aryl-alcohol dehydrogenase-like predicted oxidoreductase